MSIHLFVVSTVEEREALAPFLSAEAKVVTPGTGLAGQSLSGYTLLTFLGKRERQWFVEDVRTRIEPRRA